MKIDIKKELLIAKKAALKAGNYLNENKKNLKEILSSTTKDIKLNADIASEKIIKNILSKESKFEILAEESAEPFNGWPEYLWVVDPLDGTANYEREIPLSCVSIALISDLEPLIGVIYDFNNNELYEGSVITKALLNEQEILVSQIDKSEEGILLTGLPNNTDYSDQALKIMIKNFQNWRKVRMIGSAAIASTYIASGKAEAYSETKTYLWDIAAGAALVNAAGGKARITNKNEKFQVDVLFSNSTLKI